MWFVLCNRSYLVSPSSGVASLRPRMGGEPPWFPTLFMFCRLHWNQRKFWICFHGVEPIDFVPPYFWMGIDLLIYEYHVIGKCSVSSCQKKEWTVMYYELKTFFSYHVYHLMRHHCIACINGMIFMKIICYYLSSNLY